MFIWWFGFVFLKFWNGIFAFFFSSLSCLAVIVIQALGMVCLCGSQGHGNRSEFWDRLHISRHVHFVQAVGLFKNNSILCMLKCI